MSDGPAKRVLVVDDEEYVRLLIGQILSRAGYSIELAVDGRDALGKIEASRPDLVVLDLMMPVMDGWGVLGRLRETETAPPVIVVTAHGGYDTFARLAREGVDGYLSKPFKLRELVATCARILVEREKAAAAGERRRDPRRTLMVALKVLSREAAPVLTGELVNLSLRGAQVGLAVSLEPGERVEVGLHVPGGGAPLSFEGRVEWREAAPAGFTHGVVFVSVSTEAERELKDLVG